MFSPLLIRGILGWTFILHLTFNGFLDFLFDFDGDFIHQSQVSFKVCYLILALLDFFQQFAYLFEVDSDALLLLDFHSAFIVGDLMLGSICVTSKA